MLCLLRSLKCLRNALQYPTFRSNGQHDVLPIRFHDLDASMPSRSANFLDLLHRFVFPGSSGNHQAKTYIRLSRYDMSKTIIIKHMHNSYVYWWKKFLVPSSQCCLYKPFMYPVIQWPFWFLHFFAFQAPIILFSLMKINSFRKQPSVALAQSNPEVYPFVISDL